MFALRKILYHWWEWSVALSFIRWCLLKSMIAKWLNLLKNKTSGLVPTVETAENQFWNPINYLWWIKDWKAIEPMQDYKFETICETVQMKDLKRSKQNYQILPIFTKTTNVCCESQMESNYVLFTWSNVT